MSTDSVKRLSNDRMVQNEALPLNLWKSAAAVLPSCDSQSEDVDVVSFGGQGIGPNNNSTCQRWDSVFRLKRRRGALYKSCDVVKLLAPDSHQMSTFKAIFYVPILGHIRLKL
jgi:hypothetical protein